MGILGDIVKRSATGEKRKEDIVCSAETKNDLFEEVHTRINEQTGSGIVCIMVVNNTIKDVDGLFADCSSLNGVILKGWRIPEVRSMRALFDGCKNLVSVRFIDCDFSQVKDMRDMFSGCRNLKSVEGLSVSDFTDIEGMFDGCSVKFKRDGKKIVIVD